MTWDSLRSFLAILCFYFLFLGVRIFYSFETAVLIAVALILVATLER